MICLEGVTDADLNRVLDYIYNGEVQLYQEDLDRFLVIAQRFKLEGMIGDNTNHEEKGRTENITLRNDLVKDEVKSIIRITEEEIIESMKIIWERLKIICEPSCSLPLAAVLKNNETFRNKKVGIIISGGNVDLNNLPF